MEQKKTLIVYVFAKEYENLHIFLKRGIIQSPNYDYFLVVNDIDFNLDMDNLPPIWQCLKYPNVHLYIRENIGHDFGGYNDTLFLPTSVLEQPIISNVVISSRVYALGDSKLYTLYDQYIFLNDTVAGPYVPRYCPDWVQAFTFALDEEVKMVGLTLNCMSGWQSKRILDTITEEYKFRPLCCTHIQSMAFGLDREGLKILLRYNLFKPGKVFPTEKWDLILLCEIGMSSILRHEKKALYAHILEQGKFAYDRYGNDSDLWSMQTWKHQGLYECIFVKTNRHMTFPEKARYDKYYTTN